MADEVILQSWETRVHADGYWALYVHANGTGSPQELTMFRAWLSGDLDAAAVAADMVQEIRQAAAVPGYVPRGELLDLLSELRRAVLRLAKGEEPGLSEQSCAKIEAIVGPS